MQSCDLRKKGKYRSYCSGVVSGPQGRERKTKHNLAVWRRQRSELMETKAARICRLGAKEEGAVQRVGSVDLLRGLPSF